MEASTRKIKDGRPSATALGDLEFVFAGFKTFQISSQVAHRRHEHRLQRARPVRWDLRDREGDQQRSNVYSSRIEASLHGVLGGRFAT